MVVSSSNLLLLASTQQHDAEHHVWNDSMKRRGFMIPSTSANNNIRGSTGDLKDMIMLETVCTPTITATSSSTVVGLPESPTLISREQRDDLESVFNHINNRATSTRHVFSFPTATPSMPDMMMSMMPALPTPAMNQSSKQKNERSNSDNDNDNDNATPKKKKKKNHMGRRHSSQGEEDDDATVPLFDIKTMMTTTLQPRVHNLFPEEEEIMMTPMMPVRVLPVPTCPVSTTATATATTHEEERVVVTTTTPLAHFSSTLDQALSVCSPNEGDDDDDDDDGNDVAADDITADEWGVFASYDDADDDEDEEEEDSAPKDNNSKSKPCSRLSSFTKKHPTTSPCFQPLRAPLPSVFVATTAGAE